VSRNICLIRHPDRKVGASTRFLAKMIRAAMSVRVRRVATERPPNLMDESQRVQS